MIGAVLAGGHSRRFDGGNKATIIGPTVIAAMRAAGVDPVVAIGGPTGELSVPTVADRYPGEGPLGGVATAMTYARVGWIVTATCDLPLLEPQTIAEVASSIDPDRPDLAVVAAISGVPSVSLGCWPAAWATATHGAVRSGQRRFRHLLELGPMRLIEVEPTQLSDADDPATLAALLGDE